MNDHIFSFHILNRWRHRGAFVRTSPGSAVPSVADGLSSLEFPVSVVLENTPRSLLTMETSTDSDRSMAENPIDHDRQTVPRNPR